MIRIINKYSDELKHNNNDYSLYQLINIIKRIIDESIAEMNELKIFTNKLEKLYNDK